MKPKQIQEDLLCPICEEACSCQEGTGNNENSTMLADRDAAKRTTSHRPPSGHTKNSRKNPKNEEGASTRHDLNHALSEFYFTDDDVLLEEYYGYSSDIEIECIFSDDDEMLGAHHNSDNSTSGSGQKNILFIQHSSQSQRSKEKECYLLLEEDSSGSEEDKAAADEKYSFTAKYKNPSFCDISGSGGARADFHVTQFSKTFNNDLYYDHHDPGLDDTNNALYYDEGGDDCHHSDAVDRHAAASNPLRKMPSVHIDYEEYLDTSKLPATFANCGNLANTTKATATATHFSNNSSSSSNNNSNAHTNRLPLDSFRHRKRKSSLTVITPQLKRNLWLPCVQRDDEERTLFIANIDNLHHSSHDTNAMPASANNLYKGRGGGGDESSGHSGEDEDDGGFTVTSLFQDHPCGWLDGDEGEIFGSGGPLFAHNTENYLHRHWRSFHSIQQQ